MANCINPVTINIRLPNTAVLYQFTTAQDEDERDPVKWITNSCFNVGSGEYDSCTNKTIIDESLIERRSNYDMQNLFGK